MLDPTVSGLECSTVLPLHLTTLAVMYTYKHTYRALTLTHTHTHMHVPHTHTIYADTNPRLAQVLRLTTTKGDTMEIIKSITPYREKVGLDFWTPDP